MKLSENEEAVTSVWIGMILALFGFGLMYGIMYDVVIVEIINIGSYMAPYTTDQSYFNNLDRFRMLFDALPFLAVFGVVMWAFVQSQKREYA